MNGTHDGSERPSSGVTRHLKHGKTHVAANSERNAESNAAEDSHLKPRGTPRAGVEAVWSAVVAKLVQRSAVSTTSTSVTATQVIWNFVELSVVIGDALFGTRSTDTTQHIG